MRAASLVVLAAACASVAVAQPDDDAAASNESFHEEALLRPLPDGKVAFVAHFKQEAPLAATHFETFPKAMAQIARAARVADMELSFTQVGSTQQPARDQSDVF
jgi:phosphatidylinositol glycan class T